MDWQQVVLMFVTLTISLTFHEAAHALFALLGGDRTAYHSGQVSLNPLPHMQREPFGMVILPLLGLMLSNGSMCLGFASTPIDAYWAARNPRRAALMSAAGPLANVLLAAIAFVVLWFIGRPDTDTELAVRRIAGAFLLLNLLLAVFNCIPLRPLDGSGVLTGLFPPLRRFYDTIDNIPYSMIVTFVLLLQVLPYLFWPVFFAVDRLLPFPLHLG